MPSNFIPTVLVVGGVMGALWCLNSALNGFFAGDLAGEEPVLFAIACLVAVIGWNELRASNDFNESD